MGGRPANLVVLACVALAACEAGTLDGGAPTGPGLECTDGEREGCACGPGREGTRRCVAGAWGPCTCAPPPGDGGADGAPVDAGPEGGSGTDAGRDGGGSPGPCDGVDCGGHGRCEVVGGAARCACDAGFEASGLRCLPAGCPATLAERLSVEQVDVAPDRVVTRAGGAFSPGTPPILAPRGDRALVAWQAQGGQVHVTPLTASGGRAGPDLAVIEGQELRGLAAHEGGFAVMVYRAPDAMVLAGFDAAGTAAFETTIVGGNDHGVEGAKWIRREWGDYGRLAFAGGQYAVSFGHAQNWGSRGEHQGDLFRVYDASGALARGRGTFEWGCSHSLDLRLVHDGSAFRQVCLSDCYPSKAIYLDVRAGGRVVHEEPSGNCAGRTGAVLGGVAALGSDVWIAFVSPEAPGAENIGLVRASGREVAAPLWVASGRFVQLARYGDGLLLGWPASGGYQLAALDATGRVVLGPETVAAAAEQQTDFVTFPNGDVGWAWAEGGSRIGVARVRACAP